MTRRHMAKLKSVKVGDVIRISEIGCHNALAECVRTRTNEFIVINVYWSRHMRLIEKNKYDLYIQEVLSGDFICSRIFYVGDIFSSVMPAEIIGHI
jgi:hypothetical protein